MNPVPLVTIATRCLGLGLVVWHADAVGRLVAMLAYPLLYPGQVSLPGYLLGLSDGGTPAFVQLLLFVLGLYLFLGGRWVIGRITRGLSWPGGGTCPKCGYDVSAVESARCPECGTKLPPPR